MSKRARWLLAVVVLLVAIGLIAGFALQAPATSSTATAPVQGHPAPDFELRSVSGHRVSLAGLRGTPVLVNFWATWCIPCAQEMPAISKIFRAQHGRLAVLAVDKQEPVGDVRDFQRSYRLAFEPLLDPNGSVFSKYRVSHVQPVSFWIDARGVIRYVFYGAMTPDNLSQALRGLHLG